jgi:hypothetical protein
MNMSNDSKNGHNLQDHNLLSKEPIDQEDAANEQGKWNEQPVDNFTARVGHLTNDQATLRRDRIRYGFSE